MSRFSDSIENIRERIASAAQVSGRDPSCVLLIGASKTRDAHILREAVEAGLNVFGENRVQEAKSKIPLLPSSCQWHLIGNLQTNKARDAAHLFSWVHSVDSERLADELSKRCEAAGKLMKVLVEVNIGGEASKHGAQPMDVRALCEEINAKSHLELRGLMAVAPFREDPEEARLYFEKLRLLRDGTENETGFALPELSMGMSHDFEQAIMEGSTMVRIGTLLFGERKLIK